MTENRLSEPNLGQHGSFCKHDPGTAHPQTSELVSHSFFSLMNDEWACSGGLLFAPNRDFKLLISFWKIFANFIPLKVKKTSKTKKNMQKC